MGHLSWLGFSSAAGGIRGVALFFQVCLVQLYAVEEALCFEWIDSTIKPLDKEHRIQRFTPRKPKSTYSQANKERLKWLLANKMIHPEFEDKIRTVLSDPFIFPNDIMDRLKEDEIAWRNYRHFSDAYKRIRIAYIEAARKRPEEFEKRLNNFICKVKENKMITGFGGIEKYYWDCPNLYGRISL